MKSLTNIEDQLARIRKRSRKQINRLAAEELRVLTRTPPGDERWRLQCMVIHRAHQVRDRWQRIRRQHALLLDGAPA